MTDKHATVKAQVTEGGASAHATNGAATPDDARAPSKTAEAIRIELAEAWGDMGAAWGVTPAIARVQAYLMARQEPLTEREVREALGLSHRAASLALAEAELWGIVERVPEPRRVGRRGPAGTAYLAVGDHWQWFGRVIAERKVREGDPIVAVLEEKEREAAAALRSEPRRHGTRCAARVAVRVPRLRPPLRSCRRARPAARATRAGTLAPAPRTDPRRDDPAPVRPARRPRRRRRHRPGRRAVPAVPDGGAACDQVDVRGGQDRRSLTALDAPRPHRKVARPGTTSQHEAPDRPPG